MVLQYSQGEATINHISDPSEKATRNYLRCDTRSPADTKFCLRCREKLRGTKVTNKREKKSLKLQLAASRKTEKLSAQAPQSFSLRLISQILNPLDRVQENLKAIAILPGALPCPTGMLGASDVALRVGH